WRAPPPKGPGRRHRGRSPASRPPQLSDPRGTARPPAAPPCPPAGGGARGGKFFVGGTRGKKDEKQNPGRGAREQTDRWRRCRRICGGRKTTSRRIPGTHHHAQQ